MTSRHLLAALDTEWHTSATTPLAQRRFATWQTTTPPLADLDNLPEAVDAIQNTDNHDTSVAVTRALLDLAATEPLALRTLLQAAMPALRGLLFSVCLPAAAESSNSFDRADNETEQMLLLAASEAIVATASWTTQWPMLAIKSTTRRFFLRALKADRARWQTETDELPTDTDTRTHLIAEPDAPTAAEELAEVITDAHHNNVLSLSDARLLVASRCIGFTTTELADQLDATPDTVRRRRHRAETRLRTAMTATGHTQLAA